MNVDKKSQCADSLFLIFSASFDDFVKKKNFPINKEHKIQNPKKHENLQKEVDKTNFEFSTQKTLQLFKKGQSISQIAEQRELKEGTIWQHIATLIEYHQLRLKEVLPDNKIKKILSKITNADDKLKEVKERINDKNITYNEIQLVLANIKGKTKKKSTAYFTSWYQKTNCHRKCHHNKKQQETCKKQFQELNAKTNMTFTKKEFLTFINKHTKICKLPTKEKEKHITWKEFTKTKNKPTKNKRTLSRKE